MFKKSLVFPLLGLLLLVTGCQQYQNVPPNYLGMKLTPTGYEDHIYTPGQVDIGVSGQSGLANSLVLIQSSGLEIKEQFLGKDGSEDKEDHRILTKDMSPMTVDVRLLLALPDWTTGQGKKDMQRIFSLGNPTASKDDARVMIISAESIYHDQAQLLLRNRLRSIFASYAGFDDAFRAFADETQNGLNAKVLQAAVEILRSQNVPLRIVEARVSNLKPDENVWKARVQIQAADAQIQAMTKVAEYLRKNPDAREIYKYIALGDLLRVAGDKGQNTMIFTDISGNAPTMVPLKRPE
jgi:hypothetical protein